jgi:nitrate reductase NapE component
MSKQIVKTASERAPVTTHHHTKAEVERSLDQLSGWMDGLFRIPGTGWRFGLDALVGLIPGVGDMATTAVSFYVLAAGVRYRVPKVTLLRMGLNIAVDYLAGSIPIVGDLFDAAWKSNQRNVQLIRERASVSAEEARHGRLSDWLFVGLIMLTLLTLLVGTVGFTIWLLARVFNNVPSPFELFR